MDDCDASGDTNGVDCDEGHLEMSSRPSMLSIVNELMMANQASCLLGANLSPMKLKA